ncbi:MAG TPA: hypothetical protein VF401_04375 [Candidatus Saccharimonadales bacterium]
MLRQQAAKFGPALLLIFAALTLFLAQSAYWVNHTVFDQENFSQITTTALLLESSRDAIANSVVDNAFQNRPLIKKTIGKRVESLVGGLLGSDLSAQAVDTLTNKTYAYVTTKNRQDITVDLTGIKAPLEQVVSVAQLSGGKLDTVQQKLPDQIVLVRSSSFPNVSGAVTLMLWLGPLFWLSTFVLFGLYIYTGRKHYAKRVYAAGSAVVIVSLLGLLTVPFVPPPIAAAVPDIALRPVAENLVIGFLAPFKSQMYHMLFFALVALLVFNQRFNILSVVQSLAAKLSQHLGKQSPKPVK